MMLYRSRPLFFLFNDTANTDIYTLLYTLSLHDALPISGIHRPPVWPPRGGTRARRAAARGLAWWGMPDPGRALGRVHRTGAAPVRASMHDDWATRPPP